MTEAIWVALIGAIAVVLAAVLPTIVRAILPRRIAAKVERAEKEDEDRMSRSGQYYNEDGIFQRKLFVVLAIYEIVVGLLFYIGVLFGTIREPILLMALWGGGFLFTMAWLMVLPFTKVFFLGFIHYGTWLGALMNIVVPVCLVVGIVVSVSLGGLETIWLASFYILLVIHYFGSHRDILYLRRSQNEFWNAHT